MKALTFRQQQTLAVLQEFVLRHGHSPSRRELATLLGCRSVSSAQRHVEALERKGYLRRTGRYHRGLTVSEGPAPATWPQPETGRKGGALSARSGELAPAPALRRVAEADDAHSPARLSARFRQALDELDRTHPGLRAGCWQAVELLQALSACLRWEAAGEVAEPAAIARYLLTRDWTPFAAWKLSFTWQVLLGFRGLTLATLDGAPTPGAPSAALIPQRPSAAVGRRSSRRLRTERRILAALASFRRLYGRGPLLRELAALVGDLGVHGVRLHLQRLEAEGRIRRTGPSWRTVRLAEDSPRSLRPDHAHEGRDG